MWPQRIWKGARARIVFLILTDLNSHCSYCTGQQGLNEGSDNRNMSKVLGIHRSQCVLQGFRETGPGMLMPSQLRFTGWIQRRKYLTSFYCPGRTLLKYTTQAPTVRTVTNEPPGRNRPGWWGIRSSIFSGQWEVNFQATLVPFQMERSTDSHYRQWRRRAVLVQGRVGTQWLCLLSPRKDKRKFLTDLTPNCSTPWDQ